MKMPKCPVKVIHENDNIVISRSYAIQAAIPNSKEYNLLADVKMVYPEYKVVIREIKKASKESYRGLTYAYMEYYISTHQNADVRMAEYNEMRLRAECHSMKYGHIKKWFLSAYPQIDDFTPEDFQRDLSA